MEPSHKLSSASWHAFSVAVPSVSNSLADYLCDPALGINSFRRQLKTFLFAHYQTQRTESIKDIMNICYINLLHYLLTYCYSVYKCTATVMSSAISKPVICLEVRLSSCLHHNVLHVSPRQQRTTSPATSNMTEQNILVQSMDSRLQAICIKHTIIIIIIIIKQTPIKKSRRTESQENLCKDMEIYCKAAVPLYHL